jgi:GcrA cell cycle regulator
MKKGHEYDLVSVIGVLSIFDRALGFLTPVFQFEDKLYIQDVESNSRRGFVALQPSAFSTPVEPFRIHLQEGVILFAFSSDGESVSFADGSTLATAFVFSLPFFEIVLAERPALVSHVQRYVERWLPKARAKLTDRKLLSLLSSSPYSSCFQIKILTGTTLFASDRLNEKLAILTNFQGRAESFGINEGHSVKPKRKATKGQSSTGNLSVGVGVLDLGQDMCKWPLGEPGDNDFGFCGAKTTSNSVYCDKHFSMAFQSPAPRKVMAQEPEARESLLQAKRA